MAHMENCTEPKDDKSPEAVLIGGDPRVMTDMVKVISPVYYMKNKKNMPQFVVIHGDADDVVPYCQSKTLSEALQEIGKLTEFVTVPNGKHGPVTFNEQTYKTMVDFFKKF